MTPRVLFLPGASGAAAFWQPVTDLLPATWDTELLAWPGLGNEPPDPRIRDFEDVVRLVIDRIVQGSSAIDNSAGRSGAGDDGGGHAPVDLVAQSMGGVVAVQVALRRPQLVRRLVLVATSGGMDLAPFGVADWRSNYRRSFPSASAWITEMHVDVSDLLPDISAPTLLVWGDADAISPPAVGERLAAVFPDARLLVVAGGDHMLARDRAAEVAPAIQDHLARSAGG